MAAWAQATLPPFPDWDRATVDGLLSESPWAHAIDAPLRDKAYRSELYLTVRWASALPMRRANAAALGVESRAGKLMLAAAPKQYIIEVAGFPAGALKDGGVKRLEAELMSTAVLTSKKRKPLAATYVAVPEFGSHLMAEIHFPRTPEITLDDGVVEFTALVLAGRVSVRVKFPLKPMVYEGRLEL